MVSVGADKTTSKQQQAVQENLNQIALSLGINNTVSSEVSVSISESKKKGHPPQDVNKDNTLLNNSNRVEVADSVFSDAPCPFKYRSIV